MNVLLVEPAGAARRRGPTLKRNDRAGLRQTNNPSAQPPLPSAHQVRMGGQVGKKRKGGNPGVGVDFKRVKHKVGKKLPKAQNDTDTNFKAKSISLPSQNLKEATEAGVAVNHQNLTLKVRRL